MTQRRVVWVRTRLRTPELIIGESFQVASHRAQAISKILFIPSTVEMLRDHLTHATVDRQDDLRRIVKKIAIDGNVALRNNPLDDPLGGVLEHKDNDYNPRIGCRCLHMRLDQVAIPAIEVQLG